MNLHPYLCAYMVGISAPRPFLVVVLTLFGFARFVHNVPIPVERIIIFPMAIIPNLWGLWNMLHVASRSHTHLPLGIHGAMLPFILAPAGFLFGRGLNFLRFPPRSYTRPPAAHVLAVQFVIGSECSTQGWLFVQKDEEVDAQSHGSRSSNCLWIGVSKHDPHTNPPSCETEVHGVAHVPIKTDDNQTSWRDNRAGVPCPVHPKSHTQRKAIAKPSTDGTTANQRQSAAPTSSARKRSHCGRSHNQRAKNPEPTANEVSAAGQRLSFRKEGTFSECAIAISASLLLRNAYNCVEKTDQVFPN